MNLKETFRQALGSLGANKLRSALTLLAILIGVFAIIASQTAVLVLDNYFQETMSMMGGNVLEVSKISFYSHRRYRLGRHSSPGGYHVSNHGRSDGAPRANARHQPQ